MATKRSYADRAAPASLITVHRPRPDDGMRFALASVYDAETDLPEDMLAMLAKLDEKTAPSA